MYFDEDGELAHEFYEEVLPKKKGGARKMRRVNSRNLVPQGDVKYKHPRIHVDFPIIMYQGWATKWIPMCQLKITQFSTDIFETIDWTTIQNQTDD